MATSAASTVGATAHVSTVRDVLGRVEYAGRGGLTATNVSVGGRERLILLGGADRTGEHYNDIVDLDVQSGTASRMDTSGVVLPAFGGHATASIGEQLLVFGGINFVEERVFDEIFQLKLECNATGRVHGRWSHPTVAGEVPLGRTGHSLIAIPMELASLGDGTEATSTHGLVLFGGSSPAEGPMNDVHALLPTSQHSESHLPASTIEHTRAGGSSGASASPVSYTWHALPAGGDVPKAREMHSCFFRPGEVPVKWPLGLSSRGGAPGHAEGPALIVHGGRDDEGKCLATMHVLDLNALRWSKPISTPFSSASAVTAADPTGKIFYIYGGWAGTTELSDKLLRLDTSVSNEIARWAWSVVSLLPKPIPPPRFAAAGALVARGPAASAAPVADGPVLAVVGGMTVEEDLRDYLVIHV